MRIVLMILFALVARPPAAFAASGPTTSAARTEAVIATLKTLKSDDGPVTEAEAAANQRIYAELDGYFDFDSLTVEPIRAHLAEFSPAQKEEFTTKFRELIRSVVYNDSGDFFRRAKFTVGAPRVADGTEVVDLDASLVEEDLRTKISFHWKAMGESWKIVDVSFDGDSLVRDYQNQFARILEKEGPAGLIRRLDDKRAASSRPKE